MIEDISRLYTYAFLFIFLFCSPVFADTTPAIQVMGIGTSTDTFSPAALDGANDSSIIQFTLSAPLSVQILLRDFNGGTVAFLTTMAGVGGVNTFTWDGKDTLAALVPSGVYRFDILSNDPSKRVFREGEGFFKEKTDLVVSTGNFSNISILDAEGDGDMDFILAWYGYPPMLMLNTNSLGNFDTAIGSGFALPPGTPSVQKMVIQDFDSDGDPDVLFGQSRGINGNQNLYYRNNGDLTFTDMTAVNIPSAVYSNSIDGVSGDIDNDGDYDIILPNGSTVPAVEQFNHVYVNNGAGIFGDSYSTNVSPTYTSATFGADMADVDLDGDLDILFSYRTAANTGTNNRLYLNSGTGTFIEDTTGMIASYPDRVMSLHFLDYDGDGDSDVYITTYPGVNVFTDKLLKNDGTGNFTDVTATVLPAVAAPSPIRWRAQSTDVNGDGYTDIFVTVYDMTPTAFHNLFFISNGSGGFTEEGTLRTDSYTEISEMRFVDIDGDQDLDIVTSGGTPVLTNGPTRVVEIDNNAPTVKIAVSDIGADSVVLKGFAVDQNYQDASYTDSTTFLSVNFSSWSISAVASGTQVLLAQGSNTVTNGTFAVVAKSLLPAGAFDYVLTAADSAGNTAQDTVNYVPPYSGPWYVNDNSLVNDVYTSSVGCDTNDGSSTSPFLTIGKALSVTSTGDTIYIDAGTYTEVNTVDTPGLFLLGADSSLTIVRGTSSAANGPDVMTVQNADSVLIQNLRIQNGGHRYLFIDNCTGAIIRNVTFDGEDINVGTVNVPDNYRDMLLVQDCVDALIENNLFTRWKPTLNASANWTYPVVLQINRGAGNFIRYNTIENINGTRTDFWSDYFPLIRVGPDTTTGTVIEQNTIRNIFFNEAGAGQSLLVTILLSKSLSAVVSNNVIDSLTVTGVQGRNRVFESGNSSSLIENNTVSNITSVNYTVDLLVVSGGCYILNNVFTNVTAGMDILCFYVFGGLNAYQNEFSSMTSTGGNIIGVDHQSGTSEYYVGKNNFYGLDVLVQNDAAGTVQFARNYVNSTDSCSLSTLITGANSNMVVWTPYRLGVVDTGAGQDTVAPGLPTAISLDTSTGGQVTVNWTNPIIDEEGGVLTGFSGVRIYRDTDLNQCNWKQNSYLTQVTSPGTSFVDTNVTPGITYYYRLTSVDNHTIENEAFFSYMYKAVPQVPPANNTPTAGAGADQSGTTSFVLNLDGSASSDPENDQLTYAWSVISAPLTPIISDTTVQSPTFKGDTGGVYIIQLIVTDTAANISNPDTVVITLNDTPVILPETYTLTAVVWTNPDVIDIGDDDDNDDENDDDDERHIKKKMKIYIELPSDFNPADIITSSLAVSVHNSAGEDEHDGDRDKITVSKYSYTDSNRNQLIELCVQIKVKNLHMYAEEGAGAILTVSGVLTDSSTFTGSSSIKIINIKKGEMKIGKNLFDPARGEKCKIYFKNDKSEHVRIKLYSKNGKYINTLADEVIGTGDQVIEWDGRNRRGGSVDAGVYFVIIQKNGQNIVKRVVVLN